MAVIERLRIFVPHASDTFTNHLPHGDGLVAFEVASRLAERGHELHVMAPAIEVRGTMPPTLHLHRPQKTIGRDARGRIAYMLEVRSTYARLRRERAFEIVHQLNPVFTGISLALAGTRVPVVLGAYVAPWPRDADSADIMRATELPFAPTIRRAISALQQRLAAALILSTPAAEALVVDLAAARAKTFTIPHGIDPAAYPHDDLSREAVPADPAILFLGGTERRKGIFVLLDAFRVVCRALPNARLVIAGAGGREGDVAAVVATMPERANIDLLGYVARDAIAPLMRRTTVFAAPSNGEPFGMALLEAMASAKPVVVTDSGGPAYIVDLEGGRKVPFGDAGALAEALLDILRSPGLAAAMGRHNRAKIEQTYAWERVIDRIEGVYGHVLARTDVPR